MLGHVRCDRGGKIDLQRGAASDCSPVKSVYDPPTFTRVKMFKRRAALFLIAALVSTAAFAASIPLLNFWDPTNGLGILNGMIQSMNGSITPGSMAPYMTNRNLVDNGDMWVNQRAATATCGTTTTSGLTVAAYSADRWTCDVNITTGAGQLAVTTSSPTPPIGFINQSTLVRNSGALLAPQCAIQELPTYRATAMQGQVVNLSAYIAALAGLAADNGNTANLYLITGTGAAEGFGLRGAAGMTASVKASSFTISTSTGLITNASTVVAGQPITMTAATMPVGINAGQTYYVSTALLNSGTAFAVAPTYAQAIAGTNTVIPSTGGTTDVLNLTPIFPVWTGVAVYGANGAGQGQTSARQAQGQAYSNTLALTTAYGRYQTGPINVPTNVTEAAVMVCFSPAGTTSGGSTDGIAFTGVQLEMMGPSQTTASPYEFVAPAIETAEAQRFYFDIPDQTAGSPVGPIGTLLTTTTCGFVFKLPQVMDNTPVFNAIGTITTTTYKIYVAGDTSTLTNAGITAPTYAADNETVGFVGTLTTSSTAGWACELVGQTATAAIGLTWTADF